MGLRAARAAGDFVDKMGGRCAVLRVYWHRSSSQQRKQNAPHSGRALGLMPARGDAGSSVLGYRDTREYETNTRLGEVRL